MASAGGEHIWHIECLLQALLHGNQWDPEGEAEILIFGRPYYQKDVAKMIMNLADYHRHLRTQSSEEVPAQDASTQRSPVAAREAATHCSSGTARQAATRSSPSLPVTPHAAREAATQWSPNATQDQVTRSLKHFRPGSRSQARIKWKTLLLLYSSKSRFFRQKLGKEWCG